MFKCSAVTLFGILLLQTTTGARRCPNGWQQFSGHCYLVVSNLKTWFQAKAHCNELDGHLATIVSKHENEWIYQQLLALGGNDNFWISANQLKRQKEWRWVSNGQVATFHDKPHINDVSGSHCIALWHAVRYDWVDHPCSTVQKFICKKSIGA